MGGVAQLVERWNGIQEARGSIPLTSIEGRLMATLSLFIPINQIDSRRHNGQ